MNDIFALLGAPIHEEYYERKRNFFALCHKPHFELKRDWPLKIICVLLYMEVASSHAPFNGEYVALGLLYPTLFLDLMND